MHAVFSLRKHNRRIRFEDFVADFELGQTEVLVNLPAGFGADGRPMGLQLIGRPRGDMAVLRAAAAYEKVLPWPTGAGPA